MKHIPHSLSNLLPEVTYDNIRSRIRVNNDQQIGILHFDGLLITTKEEIQIIQQAILDAMKEHNVSPNSLQLLANYDDFYLDDDLINDYSEMVKCVSYYYKEVTRYTTRNFKQQKMKDLSKVLIEKVSAGIIEDIPKLGRSYVTLKFLGEGSFGVVHKCQHDETGQIVAIKQMKKHDLQAMGVEEFIRREIKIIQSLDHKNITKCVDWFEDDDEIFVVMEFVKYSKLGLNSEWDEHEKISDEQRARQLFWQLLQGLEYLHNVAHIVHRDLNLDNVCIDEHDQVKIIDFGCSDYFTPNEAKHNLFCGHSLYSPPEMLLQQFYVGPEVDIWSFGVLLFKVLTGYLPFTSPQKVLMGVFSIPLDDEPLGADIKDLIRKILVADTKKRLTLEQIKAHPWFDSVRDK